MLLLYVPALGRQSPSCGLLRFSPTAIAYK
jgi:hypothetical protein